MIQSSGIDPHPLTPQEASKIATGHWIPLLSLPRYLQVTPKQPIITHPYINTTDELRLKWKLILSKEKKPIVGINWQGNKDTEKRSYQGRSIPLETFSIILDNNEILSLIHI